MACSKMFVECEIFEPLLSVQTALQDLTSSTLDYSIFLISDFISKHPGNELDVIRSIYKISETKYHEIEQFVELVKQLHLEDLICRNLFYGFSQHALYFIQALIHSGIVSQSIYDKELKNPNKNYPEIYNQKFHQKDDSHITQVLSSIIDKDDSDSLQEYLSSPSISINYEFPSMPHLNNVTSPIKWQVSLINYSAYRGMSKCFKFLLLNGAKLITDGTLTSMTYAVYGGNLEIIHILESQIKIHPEDICGAIYNHHREVFDWIITNLDCDGISKKIVNVCLQSDFLYGLTKVQTEVSIDEIFYSLVKQNNIEFMKVLLKNHGNEITHIRTVKGYNTKMSTVCYSGNVDMFKLLYEHYSDQIDIDLIFDSVIKSQNLDFIKYFVNEFHPNMSAKGTQGYTPILRACELNDFDIFEYLSQQNGVDYTITNDYGMNCLFLCCKNGNFEIFKKLMEIPSIDINKETCDGFTEINPLGCAMENNRIEFVKIILNDPRIIPNIRTWYNAQHFNFKNSHFAIALRCESQEIMELLLKHPKMKITLDEKNMVLKSYPKISKEIIDNVKIRNVDNYDLLDYCYNEEEGPPLIDMENE